MSETFKLWMNDGERSLLLDHLKPGMIYLEYGCGGSTELAAQLGCKMIVSVESDISWIDKLKDRPAIAERLTNKTLVFEHVDIGPTTAWGHPKDESRLKEWPRYAIRPFKRSLEYDFILIDGRFRHSCALAACAHMLDRTIVAIHDYTPRHSYYELEKFFNLIDMRDTLVIFEKKKNIVLSSFYKSVIDNIFNP